MHTFDTPGPVRLTSRSGAGAVTVSARDVTTTTVELVALRGTDDERRAIDAAVVTQTDDRVLVEVGREKGGILRSKPQIGISVVLPHGSRASVAADSADVNQSGRLQELTVKTGSGDIAADDVAVMDLSSGSGDVAVGRCTDSLRLSTGSGDIGIDDAATHTSVATGSGDIDAGTDSESFEAKTGSGDVLLRRCSGDVVVKSGSGDLVIRRALFGAVSATTASGDVRVGVETGTAVWLDLKTVTGDVHNALDDVAAPEETDRRLELHVKTATGDIGITRA